MRKIIGLVILVSMTLHCAGRLGFLSYLYQERNSIAFSLGLVEEKPIAVCSHEYDFNEDIQIQDDQSESLPVHFPQAQEINLFLSNLTFDLSPNDYPLLQEVQFHPCDRAFYSTPLSEIFQPPRIS